MHENTVDNKKIYDSTWRDWVDMKIYGPASRWLRGLIDDQFRYVTSRDVQTVLDVGCGEGTITSTLARRLPSARVTGIDFSQTGIECAQKAYKLPNLEFVHDESSERLQQQYDIVTAFEVLEHVPEWQDLLGRMADASHTYILLSFPTGRMRPFEVIVGHVRNFKKGEVEAFLAQKGFEPVNIFYAGFPFYNPLYRELCNLTNSGGNSFTTGTYGWKQKAVAFPLYILFRFFSTKYRWGNQFCGLFKRKQ